jgi:crotonobetainyl-CoA:carnitine CoA-transferase CaiB-like acyl-CoA transferase
MGPLSDIRILELGTLIAGPFCSRILAEFGAQVIKIEAPGDGDPLRQWRKLHDGTSLWWYLQARNKKSVTVNLREPEGQEIVRELAAEADIVIENFRPGALEKWGLGWDELSTRNPGLVMVRLSGYGQSGALSGTRGIRRHRRSDGGITLCHGLSRPSAGARWHQSR